MVHLWGRACNPFRLLDFGHNCAGATLGVPGKREGLVLAFPIRYRAGMELGDIEETRPIRWQGTDGLYEVTLRFAPIDGRMECVGVDVQAVPEGMRAVTAVALHSIPLGRLIEKRRPKLGDVAIVVEPGGIVWTGQEVTVSVTRRGGRPPKYGPEHWQKVADVYREAFAGGRLTPTRAVARRFKVSDSAAAKWVAKCRQLGLLPPTTRGKARAAVSATAKGRIRLRSKATGKAVSAQRSMSRRRKAAGPMSARGRQKQ